MPPETSYTKPNLMAVLQLGMGLIQMERKSRLAFIFSGQPWMFKAVKTKLLKSLWFD